MFNSKIIGVGKYLPKNVVSNADLEKTMELQMNGLSKELEFKNEDI